MAIIGDNPTTAPVTNGRTTSDVLLLGAAGSSGQLIAAELAARGLSVTAQARTLLVPLGGDDTYDVVRDCVAALALPLCRLEQRRHQVEELFRDGEEFQHA
jgi:ABC-2 type transport system ATP-binding protein